jgi:hypothetical protein
MTSLENRKTHRVTGCLISTEKGCLKDYGEHHCALGKNAAGEADERRSD